jgi:hypothetical protein
MHKKRALISAVLVILICISLVLLISKFNDYKNSQMLLNALKEMRVNSENGFEMCGKITIEDYAKDCYSTYLSVKIENTKERYLDYENMTEQERKDAVINFLNEITESTDKTCAVSFMTEENDCIELKSVIEQQRKKVMSS